MTSRRVPECYFSLVVHSLGFRFEIKVRLLTVDTQRYSLPIYQSLRKTPLASQCLPAKAAVTLVLGAMK